MKQKKEKRSFTDEVCSFYEKYEIFSRAAPVRNESELSEVSKSFRPFYEKNRTYSYSNSTAD